MNTDRVQMVVWEKTEEQFEQDVKSNIKRNQAMPYSFVMR